MNTVTGFRCTSRKSILGVMAALAAVSFVIPSSATAADSVKISVSAIGRPPIFSNTFVDVAEEMGYFKSSGADVNVRWFQRGSDTGKAVVTNDVAVGFTSSQAGLNLIASGAPVVAIAGMPNQDWIVATDDPTVKTCKDLKGKTVAADGINNARTLFVGAVVATCGLQMSDLKLVDLANQALVKAGIAGQVNTGVWHIDELAQVEFKTGKKWRLINAPPAIMKELHYAMLLASKKAITENREGVIRFLEAWILTQKMMGSKAPADKAKFASIAANASQIDLKVAAASIDGYQAVNYWVNNDGLDQKQMMSQLEQLVKIGSVKADKKPSYDMIVDKSLYAEAAKRVEAKAGKK